MQSRHPRILALLLLCLILASPLEAQRGQASPAAQRPPQTTTPQQYPREQIETGRVRFAAQCGFCHGRDAAGGEGGTDLTRSALVAEDVRGSRIVPLVRSGRTDKGMPAFTIPDAELTAIVAFIHDRKSEADSAAGGRRVVEASDLQSGNAEAGRRYFDGACAKCHSASGDLSGIASRLQGLALLQRMLNPSAGRGAGSGRTVPKVTVKTLGGARYKLESSNQFLGRLPGTIGIKTGFTDGAGKCVIALVTRGGRRVLLVLLGAPDRWWTGQAMIENAFRERAARP